MDRENVVYLHNGILLGHEEELNPVICSNMDKPEGHYIKWNKPGMEKQIACVLTHGASRKVDLIATERILRDWERLVKNDQFLYKSCKLYRSCKF